jgi:hypothetical protein
MASSRPPTGGPGHVAPLIGAVCLLLALLAVPGGRPLQGQEVAGAPPGTRVRVTAPEMGLRGVVGVVREVPADALVVAMEGETAATRVPLSLITRLEVSAGERGRAGRGGLIGVAVGGGAGILSGAAQGGGESYLWGGFLGGLMGGLVGLVAGAMMPAEEWVVVPVTATSAGGR